MDLLNQQSVNQLFVIMKEPTTPLIWVTAHVFDMHSGPDGIVWVVKIKTAKEKILSYSVVKLCPIPLMNWWYVLSRRSVYSTQLMNQTGLLCMCTIISNRYTTKSYINHSLANVIPLANSSIAHRFGAVICYENNYIFCYINICFFFVNYCTLLYFRLIIVPYRIV